MAGPDDKRDRAFWLVCGLTAALVLYRSLLWILWPQVHFDSDHAIIGLMAKHLIEFKTFPLMFYGQNYMLGVEAWLAAPLFALFGPSPLMLKLPLLAMNLAVALLLVRILVDDVRLRPWMAWLSSLFFLIPPTIPSTQLVEVMGADIEPFVCTMLLWMLRDRPIWFGVIAGIGFENREFVIYAVMAIVVIECWRGRLFSMAALKNRAVSLAVATGIVLAVMLMKPHAALLGPGSAGSPATLQMIQNATSGTSSRLCWNGNVIGSNVGWLFTNNLATMFGWKTEAFGSYVRSRTSGGHAWAWLPLVLLCAIGLALALGKPLRRTIGDSPLPATRTISGTAFPLYLIIVGALAVATYVCFSCDVQNLMLIRYTLLVLLAPVGISAWIFSVARGRTLRAVTAAAIVAWALCPVVDDARVWREYVNGAPRNEYRDLAAFLWNHGVRYAEAGYWNAYVIDFLSNERIVVTANDFVRISEYRDLINQHRGEVFQIRDAPCAEANAMVFQRWCIIPPAK